MLASGGEVADEGGEGSIFQVVSGEQTQGGHCTTRADVPIGVELLRSRIEEQVAVVVQRRPVLWKEFWEQGASERIRGHRVTESIEGECGDVPHGV
ncbi:hypothetical protein ASE87_09240 [Frigoribacterium sp. Leaf44]|nr:hypothetical protein ASE87_09240 [Frigoribacterium sp. Leaf44]